MRTRYDHTIRALAVSLLVLFSFSCATYNQRIQAYYGSITSKNFELSDKLLEKNKLLKAPRNRLLYLLEKGRLAHLKGDYAASNVFFNEADYFMEDARQSAKDIAVGTLLNPMMQTYRGEAFEKFMLHYYKSINFLQLGDVDAALVEARRISLSSYALQDNVSERKYADDAFSLMLQGILYEIAGDINNAFISYRNSADIFIRNNFEYYEVAMPVQLKKDLLRLAYLNGFSAELQRYENILNLTYQASPDSNGGELVLFWENGLAPVKDEQQFFFTLSRNGAGNFVFSDSYGGIHIPFASGIDFDPGASGIDGIRSYRVAFPKYVEQSPVYKEASVSVNDISYHFEKAESINALAFASLKERFLKEMGLTLSRLAVKKLAEYAARPKEDDKNKKEKEAMALAIQVFNFASEKADTRNWQTLPHSIHYVRLPLKPGKNKITISIRGAGAESHELVVEGRGKIEVRNISVVGYR